MDWKYNLTPTDALEYGMYFYNLNFVYTNIWLGAESSRDKRAPIVTWKYWKYCTKLHCGDKSSPYLRPSQSLIASNVCRRFYFSKELWLFKNVGFSQERKLQQQDKWTNKEIIKHKHTVVMKGGGHESTMGVIHRDWFAFRASLQ